MGWRPGDLASGIWILASGIWHLDLAGPARCPLAVLSAFDQDSASRKVFCPLVAPSGALRLGSGECATGDSSDSYYEYSTHQASEIHPSLNMLIQRLRFALGRRPQLGRQHARPPPPGVCNKKNPPVTQAQHFP
ncbi:uncharacterized protein BP5553_03866 [Venustampulla echinocandica]|uniref:Uncharacterized protein n=1 Tax=Venustampulla echinocandica TaxID=2656787 RepID=A0A370TVH0_9HELO|nr:uncharacterized protein BP5553_03866 [Venustampulla echinocandica]RDL39526.1 hypothetical protein BP5553_03866 [Venustampulla echinocandica]